MSIFDKNRLNYEPTAGDVISVIIQQLGRSPIYIRVVLCSGSSKQGKIKVFAKADENQSGIQLIWKESTGWICWLQGKRYSKVQVIQLD